MVHIKEASRFDLMVRMIAAAARDHGPAAFVVGDAVEDLVIADVIVRNRIPVDLVAVGSDGVLVSHVARAYGLDAGRIRTADTLDEALFGRNAWVTSRRASAAKPVPPYEYDAVHAVLKFNPLSAWTDAEVRACAHAHGLEAPAAAPAAVSCRPLERLAA